ncbi:MAG: lipopolysaccharide biosynthesis protein [Prevotellaceae bacterium]|jgi:O-antigen/teichoic acid export membrane protein|nr:lipopolysaccharide biosynthesis protein [Prevotellaceae bacterium]
MAKTLKEKTAGALMWTISDRFGQQSLQFALSVILTRFFLSPEDFGLMAMLTIFIAMGMILSDGGLSTALIRKKEVSQTELSSVFYVNVAAGILMYSVLFVAAPFIAAFYAQPQLTLLCRVASIPFVLNSFAVVQTVNLTRELNFKQIAKINFIALICSAAISLLSAANGMGVWTFVFQNVSYSAVRNMCYWIHRSWRPSLVFSMSDVKALWKFSRNILATYTLNVIFFHMYSLLAGKFYKLHDVGYYSQADKLTSLGASSLSSGLQAAVYPVLSQIGNDEERLQRATRKAVRVTAFVTFPAMLGLAVTADSLVTVLLTDKWASIVPYIRILSIGWIALVFTALHLSVFYTKGLGETSLKLELVKKGIILICAVFTVRLSLFAMVTGLAAAHLAGFVISSVTLGRKMGYLIIDQIKDIFPYLCIALLMSAGVYGLTYLIDSKVLLLLLQVTSGAAFYIASVHLLGSKIFKEMLELIKKR